MSPKEGFHFSFSKLYYPLEPRDSPKWLSLKFLENLNRVFFVFSRCETTFHKSYLSFSIQSTTKISESPKGPSATHECIKLLQGCSNTISNINMFQQHKG